MKKSIIALLSVALIYACNQPEKKESATTMGPVADSSGFVSLFDGKDLAGWDFDSTVWRVENGVAVGEVTPQRPLDHNSFLVWKGGTPGDFEFMAEYRISDSGNSGVQYRSETLADLPHAVKGYQADIDGPNQWTGQNYEERGRGFLALRGQIAKMGNDGKAQVTGSLGNGDSLRSVIHVRDWNEIRIVAKGNHYVHYINGVPMSDFTDEDTAHRKMSGVLALQVHVMPSMKVEYRNIRLKQ
jgi:hypothetical protein